MPDVRSQGLRIHYELVGSGPPLLLHHGTSLSGAAWRIDGFVEALKDDFRLILIDSRGYGQSDKPHDAASYQGPNVAADVVAVIDELDLEKVHYWGYSLGARTGFVLADAHADRVSSFILGGGHPYEADMSLNVPAGQGAEAIRAAFLARFGLSVETLPERYLDLFLANDFGAVDASFGFRPSVAGALARMTQPCLVYAGEADPIYPSVKRAADDMPNARFVALPGLGHFQAMAAKDAVLPHAVNFLKSAA